MARQFSANIRVYEYDGGPTHSYERAYGTNELNFLVDLDRAYEQCDRFARVIASVEFSYRSDEGEIIEPQQAWTREQAWTAAQAISTHGWETWFLQEFLGIGEEHAPEGELQEEVLNEESERFAKCSECGMIYLEQHLKSWSEAHSEPGHPADHGYLCRDCWHQSSDWQHVPEDAWVDPAPAEATLADNGNIAPPSCTQEPWQQTRYGRVDARRYLGYHDRDKLIKRHTEALRLLADEIEVSGYDHPNVRYWEGLAASLTEMIAEKA